MCEMGSGASVSNSLNGFHQIEPFKKEPFFHDVLLQYGGYPRRMRGASDGFLPLARRPSMFDWPNDVLKLIKEFVIQLTHARFLRIRHTNLKVDRAEASHPHANDHHRRPGW